MLVNAYDNGASTGEVRRLFGILGPSDPRENLQTLLDPGAPDHAVLDEFFGMRFGNKDDADAGMEEAVLTAMAHRETQALERYRKG